MTTRAAFMLPLFFYSILSIFLCGRTATSFVSSPCVAFRPRKCGLSDANCDTRKHSCFPTQGHRPPRSNSSLRSKTRQQEHDDDQSYTENRDDSYYLAKQAYQQFLRSFWKGMALPFPQLRNVILPRPLKVLRGRKGDSSTFTVGLSFREGLMALGIYLASGVLAYSVFLEKWSIIDSL